MNRDETPAGWGGWLSGACTEQPDEQLTCLGPDMNCGRALPCPDHPVAPDPSALMELCANATIGELAAIGQLIIDELDGGRDAAS
jgi:hypothetical protein